MCSKTCCTAEAKQSVKTFIAHSCPTAVLPVTYSAALEKIKEKTP